MPPTRPGVPLAILAGLCAMAAAATTPARQDPPHVGRERAVAARQQALAARLDAARAAIAAALARVAPELAASLDPPPPPAHGYGLLPPLVADTPPPAPPPAPQVTRYTWAWTGTLLDRLSTRLDALDADLAALDAAPAGVARAAAERLAAGYRQAAADRRLADAHVAHNRLWQAEIARRRADYDRANAAIDAVLERQSLDRAIAAAAPDARGPLEARRGALLAAALDALGGFVAPAYLRLHSPAPGVDEVTLPILTDITDAAFLEAFRRAVESHWRIGDGATVRRVALDLRVLTPDALYCGAPPAGGCAPPARGAPIDLAAHVARFPAGSAVLTTGAAALHVTAGRAIVLSPQEVAPRVLAHETGHLLGFRDGYLRGYRDLGDEGFEVRELVIDPADLMSSPGAGAVLPRHFDRLLDALRRTGGAMPSPEGPAGATRLPSGTARW